MKKKVILTVILFALSILPAWSEVSLKAEVDKASITTDELLTYKITVNSDEQNTPTAEIPKFSGFNAVSQLQSSSLSFSGGQVKASIIYTYILAPTAVGKFKIEPCTIKIKNKTYSSDAIEIEVVQEKPLQPALPQSESEEAAKITL